MVASQGGLPTHPQWYRNLLAEPDTHIQIKAERRAVRARTATASERARLWPLAVAVYADFDNYQSWTRRQIPVVILTTRGSGATTASAR